MTSTNEINLSSSPHSFSKLGTGNTMLMVIIALLPLCVKGVFLYGLSAFLVILTSIITCVVSEVLFQLATKQKIRVKDCSAIVTGILLALVCPPSVPLWQVALGGVFAIIVAKEFFGGIGSNVFNPALAGRAFMFVSFPTTMGATWLNPTNGTVISYAAAQSSATSAATSAATSVAAAPVVDAVSSSTLLSRINEAELTTQNYLDFFLGNRAGCIGESSIILILLAFIFLSVTQIIDWKIPLTMVATVVIATLIAGGDVLMSVMAGGLLFGAVFMITDYATTPVTMWGRIIFAFGCGLITFLIRQFGGYPEGVMFSILIMNAVAPFLNRIVPRKYGYGKQKKAGTK